MAALYLPERIKPSEALSDIPKRLEISYLVAIKGADFAAAYFSIWLGHKPLDDNLKKALLHKR